jgi:hypothetical protein
VYNDTGDKHLFQAPQRRFSIVADTGKFTGKTPPTAREKNNHIKKYVNLTAKKQHSIQRNKLFLQNLLFFYLPCRWLRHQLEN